MQTITIVLVLKSGGPYDKEYVERLSVAITRNTTIEHEIVCLTDIELDIPGVKTIPLLNSWPGWWSKIELFRPDLELKRAVYFDLDTIILGNIDELLTMAAKDKFSVIRNLNQRPGIRPEKYNFVTNLMVGGFSQFTQVYTSFAEKPLYHINKKRLNWREGDQGFISDITGLKHQSIQSQLPNDYIVGRKISNGGKDIPSDTRILLWHGEPRLHTIPDFWRSLSG